MKIYAVYCAYHKSEILSPYDTEYYQLSNYPTQFRRVRGYKTKSEQMNAFANIMCPASQTIDAEDEEDLKNKISEMDKNFQDEQWLTKNVYPFV